ncbi:hypothetical protein B0H13DRAFT_1590807 [Mycena leptocephala]|nr:hypothetical protein B0H13DRAFT_1590807 [Mycena leptocephala]
MAANTSPTVVQTTLSLPEIVDLILHHVRPDPDHWNYSDLALCGRVNKLWYRESMPHLWRVTPSYNCSLPSLFRPIEPERRQFYASLIERASLVLAGISTAAEDDEALRDITFSKLTELQITVPNSGYQDPLYVPRIGSHRVIELRVDPRYELCYPEFFGVSEKDWEDILEQISIVFPDLERFDFEDCALVEQRVLERFAERLPRLEELDYSLVRSDLGQSACPYTLKW